jgi:hypothetical protein
MNMSKLEEKIEATRLVSFKDDNETGVRMYDDGICETLEALPWMTSNRLFNTGASRLYDNETRKSSSVTFEAQVYEGKMVAEVGDRYGSLQICVPMSKLVVGPVRLPFGVKAIKKENGEFTSLCATYCLGTLPVDRLLTDVHDVVRNEMRIEDSVVGDATSESGVITALEGGYVDVLPSVDGMRLRFSGADPEQSKLAYGPNTLYDAASLAARCVRYFVARSR